MYLTVLTIEVEYQPLTLYIYIYILVCQQKCATFYLAISFYISSTLKSLFIKKQIAKIIRKKKRNGSGFR